MQLRMRNLTISVTFFAKEGKNLIRFREDNERNAISGWQSVFVWGILSFLFIFAISCTAGEEIVKRTQQMHVRQPVIEWDPLLGAAPPPLPPPLLLLPDCQSVSMILTIYCKMCQRQRDIVKLRPGAANLLHRLRQVMLTIWTFCVRW